MFKHSEHEQVIVRRDPVSGLAAVIALHSTALGPATGGVRRWRYTSMDAAIADALRLSEGMTLKNALAGIPFGGGKSVILADANPRPTAAQLARFGHWLNELQGTYITAEDVGMGLQQVTELAASTPFVSGLGTAGVGGDPSPTTAYGVFLGLREAVRFATGATDLAGVSVAVQGLGSVGMCLCGLLREAGADLIVTDLDEQRVSRAADELHARVVAPAEIVDIAADVFAPCALGGVITEAVAARLPVQVVAGAANNQLADSAAGQVLAARGVVYAPDFVINAGGVISVAREYQLQRDPSLADQGALGPDWVDDRVAGIPARLHDVLSAARMSDLPPDTVARQRAMSIVHSAAAAHARVA